jgi:putative oxidoreductase
LRYLDRLQPLALLVVRITLGVIMIAHGYQKIFHNMHHFTDMVGGLGLPRWSGYLAACTEFFGGILVFLGLFTRAAALAMTIEMFVAIWKVHWHNGLTANGGFEFPLAVGTLAFALIFFGAGPMAFDHILRGGGGSFNKK